MKTPNNSMCASNTCTLNDKKSLEKTKVQVQVEIKKVLERAPFAKSHFIYFRQQGMSSENQSNRSLKVAD